MTEVAVTTKEESKKKVQDFIDNHPKAIKWIRRIFVGLGAGALVALGVLLNQKFGSNLNEDDMIELECTVTETYSADE